MGLHALLALLVVFALGLVACGDDDSDSASSGSSGSSASTSDAGASGEVTELKVGLYPSTDYTALYAGMKQGVFEKHGLKLSVTQILTGTALTAAITSGKSDVGTNSLTSMSTAISNGVPVKMVTAVSAMPTAKSYVNVLVKKDSDIKDFGDLQGKTIATVNLQGLFEIGVRNAIEKGGGDPSKVKAIAMAPTDEPAALEAGRVDAIVLQSPFLETAMAGGKFRELGNPFGLLDYTIASGAFFSSNKVIAEKADALKAFKEAYTESTALIADDEDAARAVIPDFTELKPDVIKTIGLPVFTTDAPEDSVNPMLEQMKSLGWIKKIPAYNDIVWDGN
jgi:NitT/TauT family transport system substrate-binding protein